MLGERLQEVDGAGVLGVRVGVSGLWVGRGLGQDRRMGVGLLDAGTNRLFFLFFVTLDTHELRVCGAIL